MSPKDDDNVLGNISIPNDVHSTPSKFPSFFKLISPSSSSGRTRKRQNEQSSPSKRQRVTGGNMIQTPPATPTKANKMFDLKDVVLWKSQLPSPAVTPIKVEKDAFASNVLTAKKLDFTDKQVSVYSKAKALFQRGFSFDIGETLPQREKEAGALKSFIESHIKTDISSSLYISGPPGTGKTAQTKLTISQFIDIDASIPVQEVNIEDKSFKIGYSYINCMTISKTSTIFHEIFKSLSSDKCTLQNSKESLLKLFSNKEFADMSIVVLDELDKLITSDQQILFELFSWTIYNDCNLILIGISNSLDMIDRLLPRLKINGLNPNTLSFFPYNSAQIENIILEKVRGLNKDSDSKNIPIFHPAAVQLCAKKSSNNTGDLRKAFDICRNSIELLEKDLYKTMGKEDLAKFDEINSPRVKITHIARICSSVFDNSNTKKIKNLNLQQKMIVCILVKKENMMKSNEQLMVNMLYEFYVKCCNIDRLIGVLKKGEFLEVLTTLESIGIVKLVRNKRDHSRITCGSSLSRKDLKALVEGISILEKLMSFDETQLNQ